RLLQGGEDAPRARLLGDDADHLGADPPAPETLAAVGVAEAPRRSELDLLADGGGHLLALAAEASAQGGGHRPRVHSARAGAAPPRPDPPRRSADLASCREARMPPEPACGAPPPTTWARAHRPRKRWLPSGARKPLGAPSSISLPMAVTPAFLARFGIERK